MPFCTGTTYNFPAPVGNAQPDAGVNYGCLASTPNPVWYYLKVATNGTIILNIAGAGSNDDIDFACWGPFTSPNAGCTAGLTNNCSNSITGCSDNTAPPPFGTTYPSGNLIDCSYDPQPTEVCTIPNAVAGQYYMVLITNFGGNNTNIIFNQTNAGNAGAGATDCSIVTPVSCNISSLTAQSSSCNPATNTYSITGSITFTNAPGTGSLTVSTSCGGSQVFVAPFTSSLNYSITNLTSNGSSCTVTAVFSASTSCSQSLSITAPGTCTVTPLYNCNQPLVGNTFIDAGTNVTICKESSAQLQVTGSGAIGSYTWQPTSSLSSNTVSNPTASPVVTTIYTVSSKVMVGSNLVANGDFETGNTGFYSQYIQSPGNAQLQGAGHWSVGNTITNGWWANCSNHSPGGNNMMFLDGASGGSGVTPGANFWCQTINVQPNTDYIFSTWLSNGNSSGATSSLVFYINGIAINAPIGTPIGVCVWNQFYSTWNSGANTTANICISESSGADPGNDFVVDDISFYQLCTINDTVRVTVNSPTISVPSSTLCNGQGTATLVAAGASTYSWSPGATLSTTTGSQTIANPSVTTTYTISGADAYGCSNYTTTIVQVNPVPTVSFSLQNVCVNNTVSITNASGIVSPYNITDYSWNFGLSSLPTSTSNIQSPVNLSYSASGIKTISLTLTSNNSCTATATQTVTIYPQPVADFAATSVCQSLTTQYTDLSSPTGSIVSYQWDYTSDGVVDNTADNPNKVYSAAGGYTTTLMVTDVNGCRDTINHMVEVYTNPQAGIIVKNACLGSLTTFTSNPLGGSGNIVQWLWDVNNSISTIETTGQQSSYLYTSAGSQSLSLIVITDHNCKDTLTMSIYVNYVPNPRFIANNISGCPILCVGFTDQTPAITGPSRITDWQWDFGNSETQNVTSNATQHSCYTNVTSSQIKQYNVTLIVKTDSGCVSTISKSNYITVYPKPIANYIMLLEDGTVLMPLVHFTNQSSDYTKWWWGFGDNSAVDSINKNPDHYYESVTANKYPTNLIVSNQYGCMDTAYVLVGISPEFTFYIPNAFTPNGDGINDEFIGAGIGISEYEMWIYDRWGEQLYYTNDINKPWDGSVKGKRGQSKQDVYIWKVRIKDVLKKHHEYTGHVTLIK